jgi:CheY-like chemotaxis protein
MQCANALRARAVQLSLVAEASYALACTTTIDSSAALHPPKRRRVLVIEDDRDVRDVVEMALVDAGYDVLVAEHGAEGLHLLLLHDRVGVVLLDMRMPVMNGWQFSAALRGDPQMAHIPIVVVTAAADAKVWAQQIGAQGYLSKPFTIQALRDEVARFLHPADSGDP